MLKQARQESGLSLTQVAASTGIDKAAISRLENGYYANTTVNTLNRLAGAYGKHLVLALKDDG
jgi:transcriptional regulator with XRE-family HTH domain